MSLDSPLLAPEAPLENTPDASGGDKNCAPQNHGKVESRNETFAGRTATRICYEQPSAQNPYIAERAYCYGYDLTELMGSCSFVEVFYLLLRGELPSSDDAQILQALMIALMNPGPRHPATRAAMNAAIGKTDPLHILPIASAVLGGRHQGAGDIEAAMRFLRKHQGAAVATVWSPPLADDTVPMSAPTEAVDVAAEESSCPGFGHHYGGRDLLAASIAEQLLQLPAAGAALKWGQALALHMRADNQGWLMTGVAAAVFADLGFQPRSGGCLLQLLCAPGLVAHGLEMANKPITAMPFVKDENYVIEP
jgi:citrate synthase